MQDRLTESSRKNWKRFSDSGVGTLPIFVLVMSLDYKQRGRQMYWIFLISILYAVQNITKLAYTEARPFWDDPSVFQGDCSGEFGNPSGHTMTAAMLSFGVAGELASSNYLKQLKFKLHPVYWFIIFSPFAAVYTVAMAFARMILGAHAINQVVHGGLIGIWLAINGHLIVRSFIMDKTNELTEDSPTTWMKVLLVVLLQLLLFFSQILTYYLIDARFVPLDHWSKNLL